MGAEEKAQMMIDKIAEAHAKKEEETKKAAKKSKKAASSK